MTKHLLTSLLVAAGLCASAQTISNPIQINMGDDNSYVLTDDPEHITYYKYTASPTEDQEVTLTMGRQLLYVSTYEYVDNQKGEWIDNWMAYQHPTSSIYKFIAKKGGEVLLGFSTDLQGREKAGDIATFSVTATPRDAELGLIPSKPIEWSEEQIFMTLGFDWETGEMHTNYATYTPKTDCYLEIVTDYIPREIYVADTFNGPWSLVEEDVLSGRPHKWRMQAEAGHKYCFKLTGSMSSMVWINEAQYTTGGNPETPFEAYVGQNLLPKEAGTYYYKLIAPSVDRDAPDNYIEIMSDVVLPGGYVSHAADNNGFNEVITYEVLRLRTEVLPRQYCIIKICKTEDTDAPEVFNVKFARPEPYDDFYSSPVILTDVPQETPAFPGKYFYRLVTPNEEGLILHVTTDYEPKSMVKMRMYRGNLGLNHVLAEGEKEIRMVSVTPNMQYILEIQTTNNDFSVPFTASIYKAPKGDTSYDPIDVEGGVTEAPAGPQKFFRYTAQSDGYVYLRPSAEITEPIAWYERTDGVLTRHYVWPEGNNVYRMKALTGVKLTFSFMNIPEGATFEITERPFQEGETMDQAIPVTETFTVPELPGNYWFKYVAEEGVKLTVSTDILANFGKDGLEGARAAYIVYVNDEDNYYIPDWSVSSLQYTNVAVTLSEGDVAYIEIMVILPENHFTVDLTAEDLEPGEGASNAILIENVGEPTYWDIPYVYYSQTGIWYKMHLNEGVLQMEGKEAFTVNIYHPSDLKNELGRTGFLDYDDETDQFLYGMREGSDYYPETYIPEEGDYLFKIIMADPCSVKIYGSALTGSSVYQIAETLPGIIGGKGYIDVTVDGDDVEIISVNGSLVKKVNSNARVELPAGLYIVKVAGKSAKVMVK